MVSQHNVVAWNCGNSDAPAGACYTMMMMNII